MAQFANARETMAEIFSSRPNKPSINSRKFAFGECVIDESPVGVVDAASRISVGA